MLKKTVSSVVFLLSLSSGVLIANAQTGTVYQQQMQYMQNKSSRYDQMEAIKSKIAGILQENKELEVEYNQIKSEVDILQGKMTELGSLQNQRKQGLSVEMPEMLVYPSSYSENIEKPDADLLTNQSYSESSGADHRLWEIFLEDLGYQKRALELELQLRKFTYEQQRGDIEKEFENFQIQQRNNLIEEKKLRAKISKIDTDLLIADGEIPKLEFQNTEMAFNLEELQKQLDFQSRETQIIKDKILLAEQKKDHGAFDKIEKKSHLQNEVDILEEDYSRINSEVKLSLSRQARKQELIKAIVEYDRQNQEATAKIEKLKLKIGKN